MNYFCDNDIVNGETVVFVKSGQNPPAAKLLFTPEQVLQVCDTSASVFYYQDKDYYLDGRNVYLTDNSRIGFIKEQDIHPPLDSPNSIPLYIDGKSSVLFSEGRLFPDLQPRFRYLHNESMPRMMNAGSLPKLQKNLSCGNDFCLVLFGDSISAGASATKCIDIAPYSPPYGERLVSRLKKNFGVEINYNNESVPSKASGWALESVDNVLRHNPDIVMLAWGMNDATDKVSADIFAANIKGIMEKARSNNKDVEFILISTMCGNPDWTSSHFDAYDQYRTKLIELCGTGVALVDITSLWEFMISRKRYIDITGNGVNHPNDFGHMIYANAIYDVLTKGLVL